MINYKGIGSDLSIVAWNRSIGALFYLIPFIVSNLI